MRNRLVIVAFCGLAACKGSVPADSEFASEYDAIGGMDAGIKDVGDVVDGVGQDSKAGSDAIADGDAGKDGAADVAADPCAGKNCDDGNACTTDSCDANTGCDHVSVALGTACAGGNACDATGTCVKPVTPDGMVLIPAGTFWMGCNATKETNCDYGSENPQHKVTLSAYYMDLTETTVAQYKACVDAGICTVPSSVQPEGFASYPGLTNNPVTFVTWAQSQQFCQWRGAGFDLPSEAQWEMAARGSCELNGSAANDPSCAAAMRTYPWGEATATCSYAVMYLPGIDVDPGSYGCGTGATWAVGSIPAGDSPYGLHDMAGNVWEWTRDWYSSTYYGGSPATDPYNSASASSRVFRGGSLYDDAIYLRAGVRGPGIPSDGFNPIGLRCMKAYP